VPGLLRLKLSEDFTFFFTPPLRRLSNLCEDFAHNERFGEPGRPMDHRYQHIDRPEVALEGSIPVIGNWIGLRPWSEWQSLRGADLFFCEIHQASARVRGD
jgi:hypothetical protein